MSKLEFPHVRREGDEIVFYSKRLSIETTKRLCNALRDGLALAKAQHAKRSLKDEGITVNSFPYLQIKFDDATNVFGGPEWGEKLVEKMEQECRG